MLNRLEQVLSGPTLACEVKEERQQLPRKKLLARVRVR